MTNTNIHVNLHDGKQMTKNKIPVHVKDYHVPLLHKMYNSGKNIYLTPKVDGIFTLCEYCGIMYECEKVNSNLFLLDVHNTIKYNSHYVKIKMLEKVFKTQIVYNITCVNDLILQIKKMENGNIPTDNNLIFTKPTFLINKLYFNGNLNDLLNIAYKSMNLKYPTDGWVLYLDNYNPIKIKPINHMTIDVKWDNDKKIFLSNEEIEIENIEFCKNAQIESNIYRCYWDNNKWKATEIRNDKTRPNKIGIILSIESDNKTNHNKFIDYDIIQKPYYFDDHKISQKNSESHNIRNTLFDNVINAIKNTNSVLDVGCGNGKLYHTINKLNNKIVYTGIDVDPYILCNASLCGLYFWEDINKINTNSLLSKSKLKLYDHIVFINSLHFVENIPQLFKQLEHTGKYVIIVGIFEDYYSNDIELNDVKVKKLENGKYDFYYKWKTEKITEKILKLSDLHIQNWTQTYFKHFEHPTNMFINLHAMIILENNNTKS